MVHKTFLSRHIQWHGAREPTRYSIIISQQKPLRFPLGNWNKYPQSIGKPKIYQQTNGQLVYSIMGWVVKSLITETNPGLRFVYKGDFCRGNSMQFLSRLSCNFKIARVNQMRFSVRFVAAISLEFLTCSKLVATSARQKLHRVAATKIACVNGPLARILISILQLFGEVSSLYCLPFSCAGAVLISNYTKI